MFLLYAPSLAAPALPHPLTRSLYHVFVSKADIVGYSNSFSLLTAALLNSLPLDLAFHHLAICSNLRGIQADISSLQIVLIFRAALIMSGPLALCWAILCLKKIEKVL